jgi:transposase
MELSEQERITLLMMRGYGDRIRSYEQVKHLFNETFPDRNPISKSAVKKTIKRFEETGSVKNRPKSGRPRSARTEDHCLEVLMSVVENPHVSTTVLSREVGISQGSVCKILHENKFKAYKIHLVHELNEDDFDRRVEYCDEMMSKIDNKTLNLNNIVFSDEATFMLNGEVNRHNSRLWSDVNPYWVREQHTQHPEKINVWVGMMGGQIIGPFFIEGNLTGDVYLGMLQQQIIPAIQASRDDFEQVWFQQDGAPPHYSRQVRHYLDNVFPNRWIGRRGFIEWPARSPDLSPLDYFMWGYVKDRVYKTKPRDIDDLRNRIVQEIHGIPQQTLRRVVSHVYTTLAHCQAAEGKQFEHFL